MRGEEAGTWDLSASRGGGKKSPPSGRTLAREEARSGPSEVGLKVVGLPKGHFDPREQVPSRPRADRRGSCRQPGPGGATHR